jgi:hypothetical protein
MLAMAACAATGSGLVEAKEPIDPGPPPSWNEFQSLVEASVRAGALDEDSLKFRWKKGFVLYSQGRRPAYYTCGLVNGKNAYGGYTGYTAFQAFVANGKVQKILWSEEPRDMWAQACNQLFADPAFPDLPTDADKVPNAPNQ